MNILLIAPNRIGDTVMSMGVVQHLLTQHPSASLTVAVGPAAAGLFEGAPNVARVVPMEKERLHGHWLKLWRRTVGEKWDIIVDLRDSAVSRLLSAQKRYVISPAKTPLHRVVHVGRLLGNDPPPEPRLWPGPSHTAAAQEVLPQAQIALAVAPTANWGGKIWPADRFAELIWKMTAPGQAFSGAPVVLFGAALERQLVEPLTALLAGHTDIIDMVGKLDLLTVAACLARARLFVGNDSGLMHMAAASGAPTIGLFGPSDEALYRPWGRHARAVREGRSFREITTDPAYDYTEQTSWMTDLSVEKVESSCLQLLDDVAAAA